jgi:hypothetical protein
MYSIFIFHRPVPDEYAHFSFKIGQLYTLPWIGWGKTIQTSYLEPSPSFETISC